MVHRFVQVRFWKQVNSDGGTWYLPKVGATPTPLPMKIKSIAGPTHIGVELP